MLIPAPLLQAVFIPVLIAPITMLLGRKYGRKVSWLNFVALTYSTLMLLMVGLEVRSAGPVLEVYSMVPLANVNFGLLADNLSLPVAVILNLSAVALSVFSGHYIDHRIDVLYNGNKKYHAVYHTLFLIFATGILGTILATNLIILYLFLEIVYIPLYFIMRFFGYVTKERVALMSFFWGTLGTTFFLVGAMLTYMGIGSFQIFDMPTLVGTSVVDLVVFFMLIGLLIKMATFGFHVWLPWVHAEHPTSIAGILAVIVGLGNYVIARILIQQLYIPFQIYSTPLMFLALVTMVYGAYLTLAQDDIKRLYACSTISQNAYCLLGLASMTSIGVAGGIFYFLSHSLGKTILFSIAGILVFRTGNRDMRKMGGLASKMPVTALLTIMGAMILSAMPPLSGFQAELIMFIGIFLQGTFTNLTSFLIALGGIIATIFTVAYTFWPVRRIFFGPPKIKNSNSHEIKEAPWSMTVPLLMLAFVSLLLGIFPSLVMDFLTAFAESLPLG
ncbi:MAG: proton-conducting transporter membrane subunit [Candidatus Poseidoniia archaeon]|jgi:NADH-quinone oxidoreductase subunit M|nr:proton-conducting transporter membrane subunit [Candidatus Poseidoniia archaeon]|tara:strand:- start:811 stop:2313 length:1503 start_codon:yes stop_codon:yes gene_type:complete